MDWTKYKHSGPQSTNTQWLLIHNVSVVRSQAGWTKAQVNQAIADANKGLKYTPNAR